MENKFGLSKKTNIAMAGVGGISMVREHLHAIVAVLLIVILAITYQFLLDKKKGGVLRHQKQT